MRCQIVVAATPSQKNLLIKEFPSIQFEELHGYRIHFGKSRWKSIFSIVLQIPKILQSINKENNWVRRYVQKNKVNLIISDNRYGFYDPKIQSIFITHQLYIKTPFVPFVEKYLQQFNYRLINKFTSCWVPDFETAPYLGGILAHPAKLPSIPVSYIGPITRFKNYAPKTSIRLLIILSGPEPQRSIFEKLVMNGLADFKEACWVVRGLPEISPPDYLGSDFPKNILLFNHLPAAVLNDAVLSAGFIISRPGYTTIMDVLPLAKKCLFVPTPAQSEQEYLAKYLSERKMCSVLNQSVFTIQKAWDILQTTPEAPLLPYNETSLEKAIEKVLKQLT